MDRRVLASAVALLIIVASIGGVAFLEAGQTRLSSTAESLPSSTVQSSTTASSSAYGGINSSSSTSTTLASSTTISSTSSLSFTSGNPTTTTTTASSTSSVTSTSSTTTRETTSVSTSTTVSSSKSTSQTSTTSSSTTSYAIGVVTHAPSGAKYPAGAEYPTGPVFARFRVFDNGWTSPQYDAQQILAMIAQLHPDVLERMTTETFDVNAPVPVCSGCQPMNYGQFLNASMDACGCYIMPRLDLNATWSSGTFLTDAKQILDTPVSPRFQILSVDNWGAFCQLTTCTCSLAQQIFAPLYSMGWKGVGVLNAGPPYYSTCGWATFVDFDIDANTWTVPQSLLNSIKADDTVQKILLYDPDFPGQAQTFLSQCNPTCDSDISSMQTAVSQQSEDGYLYIYPIEQGFWDANQVMTSPSGTFHGQSLYELFQSWMEKYD